MLCRLLRHCSYGLHAALLRGIVDHREERPAVLAEWGPLVAVGDLGESGQQVPYLFYALRGDLPDHHAVEPDSGLDMPDHCPEPPDDPAVDDLPYTLQDLVQRDVQVLTRSFRRAPGIRPSHPGAPGVSFCQCYPVVGLACLTIFSLSKWWSASEQRCPLVGGARASPLALEKAPGYHILPELL